MPISLEFWELGCPKRGDTHITITTALNPHPAFAILEWRRELEPKCLPQFFLGLANLPIATFDIVKF